MTLMAMGRYFRDTYQAPVFFAIPSNAKSISEARLMEARALGFHVFRYRNKSELDDFAVKNLITHTYVFSGGRRTDLPFYDSRDPESFRVAATKHITHVVFRNYDPHGDVYAYVSDWLYRASLSKYFFRRMSYRLQMAGKSRPQILPVPHFVDWEDVVGKGQLDIRQVFGIDSSQRVVGRIGGFDQFDDKAAKTGIKKLLTKNEDFWVFCVNTQHFFEHPRLVYLDQLSRPDVLAFYKSCDVLINGRRMGESYGYSIVEPLSLNKPVVAPHWVRNPWMDRNHISILSGSGALYKSARHFVQLVKKFSMETSETKGWESLVLKYRRENAVEPLRKVLEILD